MGNESGEWIIYGLDESDPACLRSPEELTEYVKRVGFLPLFRNAVPGFSAEEHCPAAYWWSGDERRDPWEWRRLIARAGEVAYGKFFDGKAGFVSLDWLPYLVNYRRDGYDFDARYEDGRAGNREKRIMELFTDGRELLSCEAKTLAGFGKGGEKNFDGTLTALQMETYLTVRDFRQRTNRAGEPYGWAIAVYAAPETLWGYETVTAAYGESPEQSRRRVWDFVRGLYPRANERELKKLLK